METINSYGTFVQIGLLRNANFIAPTNDCDDTDSNINGILSQVAS